MDQHTPYEESLQEVFQQAKKIADEEGTIYNSGHLLIALLHHDGAPKTLLNDRKVSLKRTEETIRDLGLEEQIETITRIEERCTRMAQGCGSAKVTTMHLMIVLCSLSQCVAFGLLSAMGLNLANLRTIALALATGGRAKRKSNASDTASDKSATISLSDRKEKKKEQARRDPRVTKKSAEVEIEKKKISLDNELQIDEELFPTIASLGRNLSLAAQNKEIEPLVGRTQEVEQILDILGKRRANNPCLIGEPGVGKTAIVEGLAYLQINHPDQVPFLNDRVLIELNLGSLLSGTALRGAFSERMALLREEMEQANGSIILFLDEIHNLVGAGAAGEGSFDAVSELSTAMAQGRFPCVGATTTENYRKTIEQLPAFQRRLEPILVGEPSREETIEILKGIAPAYAKHHEVNINDDVILAAVKLSQRYIADRFLPDKAINLLDLAGSRAHRKGQAEVRRHDIATLVAEIADIPAERLLLEDVDRFLHMEDFLKQHIVSHSPIITRVSQVIRRNYAGFATHRPIGSFLFLGPTGVGKTELVKVLADFLFSSREALCRVDMSEYMEAHSVARLIGSPPGYVGHEDGGQLTEAIRKKPYQIVLLDEIEKAHRDVLQILLQILDDGRLTDGRGRTVDFSNAVIVMTSNLGSEHYDLSRSSIGFGSAGEGPPDNGMLSHMQWKRIAEDVLKTARRAFPIELWNRIEDRLVFQPLSRQDVRSIAQLLVASSSLRLHQEREIEFIATEEALDFLIDHGGYDPLLGARPMRTTIQRYIETPIAEEILKKTVDAGDILRIHAQDGQLILEKTI